MNELNWIITILILIWIPVGIVWFMWRKAKRTVDGYFRHLLGVDSLKEGVQMLEQEAAVTPKSVSSATKLYLPSIMKDFPEFHYDEMKTRAENVLVSYLQSIDAGNISCLTEGTNELKDQLSMRIQMLKQQGMREHFEDIRIHRTEIHQYRKEKGRRSIVLQSAIEYIHYIEKDDALAEGRSDITEQAKYNVEIVYIQDQELVENLQDSGLGLNCPNCGAPLPEVGAKKCAYCDTPVIELNIRTWNFSRVLEK